MFSKYCYFGDFTDMKNVVLTLWSNPLSTLLGYDLSYLNSPRMGCQRVMKISAKTILGLIGWKTTSTSWKWKTTSNFSQMEDDLTFFKNARRPQFSKMEDDLNFFKNERQPQYLQRWKTTWTFLNGRQPHFFQNGRQAQSSLRFFL
jgi:hypothetical protein